MRTGDTILADVQRTCRALATLDPDDDWTARRAVLVNRGVALANELRAWLALGGAAPNWRAYPGATDWCHAQGVPGL